MVGNNSAAVVADAAVQGLISREDLEVLYRALVHGTENVHPSVGSSGRKGHEYYNGLGYIPYDVGINESVARTLEYAYDDWCISRIAEMLDRPQEEKDLYLSRAEALFGFRHVAVRFEARRRILPVALLPCAVARLVFADLFGLLRVEAIERMDHASAEIELGVHRMQFGA